MSTGNQPLKSDKNAGEYTVRLMNILLLAALAKTDTHCRLHRAVCVGMPPHFGLKDDPR